MARRGDICEDFDCTMFRLHRKRRYKTTSTFARAGGWGERTVIYWESGQRKPTYRNLVQIAKLLKIPPRLLIISAKRYIFDRMIDTLVEFWDAPPELKHQTKVETRVGDDSGSEIHSETKTQRELKLTAKEAIELTDKLGYFDDVDGTEAEEDELNDLWGQDE